MKEGSDLPLERPLGPSLYKITERLASELAAPTASAPDWSPIEWQLACAVAAIHCVAPLLAGSLRWQGPTQWRDFLAEQKAHVTARYRRIEQLLQQIDTQARGADVAIVGLKGAALHSMGLYRAGERPMADLDLLVHTDARARAVRLLESLGFKEAARNWKHGLFMPQICNVHAGLGEHADNYLKIDLHTRITERLPLHITDVTDSVYPRRPHPGLNAYPSPAALLTHLLIHAAGAMAYRAMKLLQLHDIALLSAQMTRSDWNELTEPGNRNGIDCGAGAPTHERWWALPPLQLTALYYPGVVPADVLATLSSRCNWTLRQVVRHRRISDVSLSYPWIEAFPGIGWSQSLSEALQYVGGRIWPNAEMRHQRDLRVETEHVAAETQWCRLSQRQRLLRWMTSRPFRVETLHAVRMALTQVKGPA